MYENFVNPRSAGIYIYIYTYTNWPEALLEVFVGADGALGAATTDHWLSLFSRLSL